MVTSTLPLFLILEGLEKTEPGSCRLIGGIFMPNEPDFDPPWLYCFIQMKYLEHLAGRIDIIGLPQLAVGF